MDNAGVRIDRAGHAGTHGSDLGEAEAGNTGGFAHGCSHPVDDVEATDAAGEDLGTTDDGPIGCEDRSEDLGAPEVDAGDVSLANQGRRGCTGVHLGVGFHRMFVIEDHLGHVAVVIGRDGICVFIVRIGDRRVGHADLPRGQVS